MREGRPRSIGSASTRRSRTHRRADKFRYDKRGRESTLSSSISSSKAMGFHSRGSPAAMRSSYALSHAVRRHFDRSRPPLRAMLLACISPMLPKRDRERHPLKRGRTYRGTWFGPAQTKAVPPQLRRRRKKELYLNRRGARVIEVASGASKYVRRPQDSSGKPGSPAIGGRNETREVPGWLDILCKLMRLAPGVQAGHTPGFTRVKAIPSTRVDSRHPGASNTVGLR